MAAVYETLPLPVKGYIRLLDLRPSQDDSTELECRLVVRKLSTKLVYTAVSYMWDEYYPAPQQDLLINDVFKLKIFSNLAAALRAFRNHEVHGKLGLGIDARQKLSRPISSLWIDQVCINQKDETEKGHQVRQMGQIYSQAVCVFIWLGKQTACRPRRRAFSNPKLLNRAWKQLEKIPDKKIQIRRIMSNGELLRTHRVVHSLPPGNLKDHIWSLRPLFRALLNGHWKRCWIVQEFVLAKSFLLITQDRVFRESDVDDLTYFTSVLEKLMHHRTEDKVCFNNFFDIYDLRRLRLERHERKADPLGYCRQWQYSRYRSRISDTDFLSFVTTFHKSKSKEERDHVYAFLGLFPHERSLHVDYSRPLFDLFWDVVVRDKLHVMTEKDDRVKLLQDTLLDMGPAEFLQCTTDKMRNEPELRNLELYGFRKRLFRAVDSAGREHCDLRRCSFLIVTLEHQRRLIIRAISRSRSFLSLRNAEFCIGRDDNIVWYVGFDFGKVGLKWRFGRLSERTMNPLMYALIRFLDALPIAADMLRELRMVCPDLREVDAGKYSEE